jgi:DNA-binding response OmpR family regulator
MNPGPEGVFNSMNMRQIRILWADDEMDLLTPHLIFLKEKGYDVLTATNGEDALDLAFSQAIDIVLLDENMPGLTGLETLVRLKARKPDLPVVMITKSEEERIMDDAIGSKISDYLIKPVNPKQILLALKKNLDTSKLVSDKVSMSYQQEFRNIGMELNARLNYKEWAEVYKKLVFWEIELQSSDDQGLKEILATQKSEANNQFCRYFERNYLDWLHGKSDNRPPLSHTILKDKVFPLLGKQPVYLIVIDNLRYDQWKVLQGSLSRYFRTVEDDLFYAILPSATHYARNALFAGLMPSEIEKRFPKYWVNEDAEGSKNNFEAELLGEHLRRYGKQVKLSYNKILSLGAGRKLMDSLSNLDRNDLNVIVYNFVDMLSHARTDMEVIKELADDEPAYRSLTVSWFEHSPLKEILVELAGKQVSVIITTDHGSIRTTNPVKILGDRNTSTNLRYKTGRSLQFDASDAFEIRKPEDAFLPRMNLSSSFVFCRNSDYFVYPNNYSQFANLYRNTFQHGGLSMEEILVPFISLQPK